MKVLYFHQHFSTPKGSTGIRSYEMARRLVQLGHEVTMVCGSYGGGETGIVGKFQRGMRSGCVEGINVIELDLAYSNSDGLLKRAFVFLRYALRSIRLAFSEEYDVLFATTTPLTAGIPGIFAKWFRGKPFVFEVRDLWPELPKAMGVITNPLVLFCMSVLEWCSYRSADRCIGLSPGIVAGITKRGVDSNSVALVPNGCDLSIFAAQMEGWRPEGVKDTDLMAVFSGTHGVANGLDTVLDTAAELKTRKRSDIKIVLIGQGKLKPELQARAAALSLDNVVFHEPVDKAKLAGLLGEADVGLQLLANVSAFYYGTSPNKFFDYISAGLPVINNYPGWLSEIIVKNDCGYVVPPDAPEAFASALEYAADNRNELIEKGKNSLIVAKKDFDRRMLADKWAVWVEGAC